MIPRLTTQGRLMMSLALQGTELKFTKLKIGSGAKPQNYTALTDVVNEVAAIPVTIEAVAGEGSEGAGYVKLVGTTMRNTDFQADFYYTELGVFCEDPDGGDDLLYAYAHYALSGDAEPVYVPVSSSTIVQLTPTVHVYVGDAENVTATISQATSYALKVDLQSHIDDHNNPHQVTKAQIGLGSVPNKSTNNQTPTYTVPTSPAALVSGEKLGVAFGKIARAVQSLIDHIGNKNNPHAVTAAQVSAAPTNHKSAATTYGVADSNNYGHVKLTDSFTGSSSAVNGIAVSQKALNEVYKIINTSGGGIATGSYVGSGGVSYMGSGYVKYICSKSITVEKTPKFIIIFRRVGEYDAIDTYYYQTLVQPRNPGDVMILAPCMEDGSGRGYGFSLYYRMVCWCSYDDTSKEVTWGDLFRRNTNACNTNEAAAMLMNTTDTTYDYVVIY